MYSGDMDTRERLIESMQELLWNRGYVGTSPKAVQQLSGAGQGSMYHHFSGKPDLALAAIRRSAEQSKEMNEASLSGKGSAFQRIEAFLLREREVMRGCRLGRLTQDPDILANPLLRQPLDEAFDWLRKRLAEVFAEGQAQGEFVAGINSEDVVTAIIGIVQGGYVLSRAAGSEEPFHSAIRGALGMLASLRSEE
jgi:AcrR family transcriptional regulator